MEGFNSRQNSWLMIVIFMAGKDAIPVSMALALLTLSCNMIDNFIATLEDLGSCFRFLVQSFSCFLISIWEKCRSRTDGAATPAAGSEYSCVKRAALIKAGDIQLVMERLGISWDSSDDEDSVLGSGEVSNLFDEIEPSFEEVKEAFGVFDGNKDGYIDAKDLETILCALGFVHFSESECQKMINVALSNYGVENTRIDFRNFVKIIESNFS